MILSRILPALILLTIALSGCRQPAVESYRIPKETVAKTSTAPNDAAHAGIHGGASTPDAPPSGGPMSGGSTMANTPVATTSGSGLAWTAPAAWKTKTASAMRKGSYTVVVDGVPGEGDLSITAFPGDVGGDLANVNRWRNELQLPPIATAELASAVTRLSHNGLQIGQVELVGGGRRTLSAWAAFGGSTWFFKLIGPDAVVAKAKPDYLNFLGTIKPAADKQ